MGGEGGEALWGQCGQRSVRARIRRKGVIARCAKKNEKQRVKQRYFPKSPAQREKNASRRLDLRYWKQDRVLQ